MIDALMMAGAAWYVQQRWRRKQSRARPLELEVLGTRYVQGEIGRNEYLQMRDDIMGHNSTIKRLSRSVVSKVGGGAVAGVVGK